MKSATSHAVTPRDLIHAFIERRRLWIVPTIVCTAAGIVCALAMSPKWEATQAIIVRQEAAGSQQQRPGDFSNLEEMKRTQETILEIAKCRSVLQRTLEKVGRPPSLVQWGQWPAEQDIEDLRRNIRMTPPGGAEFGMTEVVYLAVRSKDRERALLLLTALCSQLEERFMQVRDERAQSVLDELQKTVSLAEEDLQAATAELAAFESAVGADLTELRMLLESSSGTSDIRQKLVAMENSKQEVAARNQQQKQLLEMLYAAEEDPLALIATPNTLLDAQPALRRLKEGLVEAQLLTSRLLGRRSPSHPDVIAAQFAEAEVQDSLRRELSTAIRGVEVDLKISTDRLAAVEAEIASGTSRLERLATLRAPYANLVALTGDRAQLLEQARMHLAEAHASQASARAASLIGRIDAAHVGSNPVGPGRSVVAGAGVVAGLSIGVALVFLFGVPTTSEPTTTAAEVTQSEVESGVAPQLETVAPPVPAPAAPIKTQPAVAATVATASDDTTVFGMFRGKTLRQALEELRRRDAAEAAKPEAATR